MSTVLDLNTVIASFISGIFTLLAVWLATISRRLGGW